MKHFPRQDQTTSAFRPKVVVASFWTQYTALLRKHWIQVLRHKKQTLAQLLSPILVILCLLLMQALSNYVLSQHEEFPPTQRIQKLHRCIPGKNQVSLPLSLARLSGDSRDTCRTIVYAPASHPGSGIEQILRTVAAQNGLSFDDDFLLLPGAANLSDPINGEWANVTASTAEQCVPCNPAAANPKQTLIANSILSGASTNQIHDMYGNFSLNSLCLPCGFVRDNITLTNWMMDYPNGTQNFLLFPTPYIACSNLSANPYSNPTQAASYDQAFSSISPERFVCDLALSGGRAGMLASESYILYYNYSIGQYPFIENDHALELKRALDAAFLTYDTNQTAKNGPKGATVELDVGWRHYPTPQPRIHGYDVVAANGGTFFYLPPMIIFFVALTEVVEEKAARLRIGMRQMGLRTSAFWAAWLTYGLIMSLGSTLLLILVGRIADFSVFVHSNFFVPLLIFFLFGAAMVCVGFFLSTLLTHTRTAQTLGYSIVLMGFVFQTIMSSGYGALVDLLYDSSVAPWIKFVRWIFGMYPPFNMAKLFYDLSARAGSEVNFHEGIVVTGPGFHWSDLADTRRLHFFGFDINVPAPREALGLLLIDSLVYFILAIYLDAVLPGDQGAAQHPLFFLSPLKRFVAWIANCWRSRNKSHRYAQFDDDHLSVAAPSSLNSGVKSEHPAVSDSDELRNPPRTVKSGNVLGVFSWALESVSVLQLLPKANTMATASSSTRPIDDTIRDQGVLQEAIHARNADRFTQPRVTAADVSTDTGLPRDHEIAIRVVDLVKVYTPRRSCCTWLFMFLYRIFCVRTVRCGRGFGSSQRVYIISCCNRRAQYAHAVRKSNSAYDTEGSANDIHVPLSVGSQVVLAVDRVSLTVRRGEVFCLLGHNGAGKTTTLSILTGLFTASGGIAEVLGHDVASGDGVREAQKHIGVCPQHDILWSELSAQEHMDIFAAIKGLQGGKSARRQEVERVLRFVGLWDVRDRPVGAFSGGMKRRLSLAISAIGDPDVILCDEPTTGMDPVNRRAAWRLIQSLKQDRAIVLTTHDMVEAETLSDRVGIMAHGKLWALGSVLGLKNTYGSGYRLSFTLPTASQLASMQKLTAVHGYEYKTLTRPLLEFVRKVLVPSRELEQQWRDIKIVAQDAGAVTIAIPSHQAILGRLAELLERLEARQGRMMASRSADDKLLGYIREWGMSHTSLEDVFLAVSRMANFELAVANKSHQLDDEDDVLGSDDESMEPSQPAHNATAIQNGHATHEGGSSTSTSRNDQQQSKLGDTALNVENHSKNVENHSKKPPTSYSYRALFRKNITLQLRQRGLCICQILAPLTVMGLLVLLQTIIKSELADESTQLIPAVIVPLNLNMLTHSLTNLNPLDPVGGNVDLQWENIHSSNLPATPWKSFLHVAAETYFDEIVSEIPKTNNLNQYTTSMEDYEPLVGDVAPLGTDYTFGSDGTGLFRNTTNSTSGENCLLYFFVTVSPDGNSSQSKEILWDRLGTLTKTGEADGLLGQIPQINCTLNNGTQIQVPFFEPRASPKDAYEALFNTLEFFNNVSRHDLKKTPPCPAPYLCPAYMLPDGYIDLHELILYNSTGLNSSLPSKFRTSSPNRVSMNSNLPQNFDLSHTIESQHLPRLAYTLAVNDAQYSPYHRANNFTRLSFSHMPHWIKSRAVIVEPARLALMDYIFEAYRGLGDKSSDSLGYNSDKTTTGHSESTSILNNTSYAMDQAKVSYFIQQLERDSSLDSNSMLNLLLNTKAVATMPVLEDQSPMQIVEVFGSFLYPIALTLQLPLYLYVMVLEKETRLVELQKIMGMRYWSYLIVNYILDIAMYIGVASFFWIVGAALKFSFFSQTSPAILFVLLIGWGVALVSFAFLLTSFISSRRVATVVGYVVALFGNLIAIVLCDGIYGNIPPYSIGSVLPAWLYVIPLFGLVRSIYLLNFSCIFRKQCFETYSSAMHPGSEIYNAIVSLYICAIVYMLIALYLDQVLPRQYGVPKHPLFCCPRKVREPSSYFFGWLHQKFVVFKRKCITCIISFTKKIWRNSFGKCVNSASTSGGDQLHVPLINSPTETSNKESHQQSHQELVVMEDKSKKNQGGDVIEMANDLEDSDNSAMPHSCIPRAQEHLEYIADSSTRLLGEDSPVSFSTYGATLNKPFLRDLLAFAEAETSAAMIEHARHTLSATQGISLSQVDDFDAVSLAYGCKEDEDVVAERLHVDFVAQQAGFEPEDSSVPPLNAHAHDDTLATTPTVITKRDYPVFIRHLRKVYPGVKSKEEDSADHEHQEIQKRKSRQKVAVSDFSLAVPRGECFGLLGENGAGKTTLISMLSGVFPPSTGDAWVGGHHIVSAIDAAHLSTGLCPQHDILWEDLTVEEHLLFYSRLKGISPPHENTHVQHSLDSVGLASVRHRYAKNLSGGMKRRLSVALSLVGDSYLSQLDEPTTGLDPSSRRRLWRIIARAKKSMDRALILTTHSMDEAELLCSRIAIVTHGRIRVLGTQQHLKSKYGGGYKLEVSFAHSESARTSVFHFIASVLPQARLDASFKGFASFLFPAKDHSQEYPLHSAELDTSVSVSRVFVVMASSEAREAGVLDWGVGQVSLEDVFQRVVRAHRPLLQD